MQRDLYGLGSQILIRILTKERTLNLVFPPQKLNSNDTLQRDTRGFNAAFSL